MRENLRQELCIPDWKYNESFAKGESHGNEASWEGFTEGLVLENGLKGWLESASQCKGRRHVEWAVQMKSYPRDTESQNNSMKDTGGSGRAKIWIIIFLGAKPELLSTVLHCLTMKSWETENSDPGSLVKYWLQL